MSRRRIIAALAGVAALIAVAALATAWSRDRSHLVRVGGMGNACTCTQRIEP